MPDAGQQQIFQRLKAVCVPLLGSSLLTPSSIPGVSKLLTELIEQLHGIQSAGTTFNPSQISYIFFPVSAILRRNASPAIPDQIFEKIFIILRIICKDWWWTCETAVWEQIFMLCGAIIGGMEGKGKGKQRDDETKEAATECLLTLLRVRSDEEEQPRSETPQSRLLKFQEHARTAAFVPVLGQTLNSLLFLTDSRRLSLQRISLDVLYLLLDTYFPDYLVPSVLPGVVSSMNKLVLGIQGSKGWANGEIVAKGLAVMEVAIVRSIGDEVCTRDGAIRSVQDLEDFAIFANDDPTSAAPENENAEKRPYATARTPVWLRGTSSQLHIALNSLTALVKHPTPSALLALSKFSSSVLVATPSTLPQSQALLLSFLLSLFTCDYPSVSTNARNSLLSLLTTPSPAQHSLLQTLVRHTRDNLATLPRLLSSQADTKVEHVAGLIEAVSRLGTTAQTGGLPAVSLEIGKLLGTTGGIEKWGWSLLSVLEFVDPPVSVTRTSAAQLMLESDSSSSEWAAFPELTFKNLSTRSTYEALERMFHALGLAAGDACLPSVEWFSGVGQSGTGARAVAAMWCACRLLEGAANVSLVYAVDADPVNHPRSKRLEDFARQLAKSAAQLWDEPDESHPTPAPPPQEEDISWEITHVKGVKSVHETLRIVHPASLKQRQVASQPMLHKAMTLQLLAVTSGILQARFTPLLIYTLYPILHSLVSPISHLSSTALATLNFITISTSYASPANLLMSNFDYALDAISRRLSRRWLDVDATKVFVIMIHIIGNDVVERAGDVVEECFDRLDEYHGYKVIVEGLVEVLGEVIRVIETEEAAARTHTAAPPAPLSMRSLDSAQFNKFFEWFETRGQPTLIVEDDTDYDAPPQEALGDEKKEDPQDRAERLAKTSEHADPPPTPTQALTRQIVSRSMYFLTHGSPVIRARILTLLASSVPVLHESALMPYIHSAWPFLLNRLADAEFFVVCSAASLVESLSIYMGGYMFRRIWDDIWPRFHKMLGQLDAADSANALARRGPGAVGTESAYTYSHRLYRSLLKTMTAAFGGVPPLDSSVWQVIISFRRFLHSQAHDELQQCARDLYVAIGKNNADAVWLALHSTMEDVCPSTAFLRESKWDISRNVDAIFTCLDI